MSVFVLGGIHSLELFRTGFTMLCSSPGADQERPVASKVMKRSTDLIGPHHHLCEAHLVARERSA